MSEPYILCLQCRALLSEEECESWGCPKCGNKGVPADNRRKATITLTHHEWRVLFMWADNWAQRAEKLEEGWQSPMPSIIREVRRQVPELPGLTLMEDIQQVANAFGKVELSQDGEITVIEPEKKH